MHILDLIHKKQQNIELSKKEITWFINEYVHNNLPDYQISALLMAIWYSGMTEQEATHLALAMAKSGDILDLSIIKGYKFDKHSTGGVGDKVTLVLAPLLAACGMKVAKMSGRGLGHTGGTIDKLESIPGLNTSLTKLEFINQVNEIGVAIAGQTGKIAPADKKLYALRDVTGTVDSIPLIAASIMSKKIASGADVLCLDIKVGSGAFMKTIEDATKLAKLMVKIGKLAGIKTTAVLTNMDEPLGHKIGNGLEVFEAIEALKNQGPSDLKEVTLTIGSLLLITSNPMLTEAAARLILEEKLANNEAYNKFFDLIKMQNGDVEYIKYPINLINNAQKTLVYSVQTGYINRFDTELIGISTVRLGAGRENLDSKIFYDVGIDLHKKVGDYVQENDLLATIYHHNINIKEAQELLLSSIKFATSAPEKKLILGVVK